MLPPLLSTKLFVPQVQPDCIRRPRLYRLLERDPRPRLTLLSAPAGYGKTTLVVDWLVQSRLPVAWISIDEGDNDPVRFISYLVAAVETAVSPELGLDSLSLLQSSQTLDPAGVLTPLVNQLAQVAGPQALVLDDYHLIHSEAVHAIVAFLLEYLPPQIHLVIITRADPPLPIARLRGQGQITELRLIDLCFNADEAARFLGARVGPVLAPGQVEALTQRTEGWVAGLQMAAASLQVTGDAAKFVRSFTASNRFILDYLIEEVIQRQSPKVQSFLMQTCILDRLCGPLCDAVVGHAGGATTLKELEQANLFIIPLDDQRKWYRYHRLFADLLQQRLGNQEAERIGLLHRRASKWYQENGLKEEAIEHALSAGDVSFAADLIQAAAEQTLMRSEVATFLHWIDQLPVQEIRKRLTLGNYRTWALLWRGESLQEIQVGLNLEEMSQPLGPDLSLRAVELLYQGKNVAAGDLALQLLERLPENETLLHSLTLLIWGGALLGKGDMEGGIEVLQTVVRQSRQAGNVMVATIALCRLADLARKQGELRQAEALYQQALELATDDEGKRRPIAGQVLIGLGVLAHEWNELERAEALLEEGIALLSGWGQMHAFEGYLALAATREWSGDPAGAQELLDRAGRIARRHDITAVDARSLEVIQARIKIHRGDLAWVTEWTKRHQLDQDATLIAAEEISDTPSSRLRKYEYPAVARLWLAESRYDQVLVLMERLKVLASTADRRFLAIEAHLLSALALDGLGKRKGALAELREALVSSEPQNLIRVFLMCGKELADLLRELGPTLSDEKLAAYANRVLANFQGWPDRPAVVPGLSPDHLVEPLSRREMDVLRLLPSSLSISEMAAELTISVNTLRTHLKHVYAKLHAHSRYEALVRAKELDLLP